MPPNSTRMNIIMLIIILIVIAGLIGVFFPKLRRKLAKLPGVGWFIGEALDWRRNLKEIFFAVIIVMLINLFLIQNYLIPTGSMEPKLMPNDRLFANRIIYGVKVPFTDGIKGMRLPKVKYPERGDIVVFRAPPSSYSGCQYKKPYRTPSPLIQALETPVMLLSISPFSWDPRIILFDALGERLTGGTHLAPAKTLFGLKTVDLDPGLEYVKRVIGVGGDDLMIRNKQVYINGKKIDEPWKHHYDKQIAPRMASPVRDNYGPIKIPKVGDTITFKKLSNFSYDVKKMVFLRGGQNLAYRPELRGYEVLLNGKPVGEDVDHWLWINVYQKYGEGKDTFDYKVDEPFYFVMGDNRDNSCDSRMWGLVEYRFIKGQPNINYFQAPRRPEERKGYLHYLWIN